MRLHRVIDTIAVLALAASGTAAGAGTQTRHLRFEWATPTPAASCALVETDAKQKTVRHSGTVERQDMGHVCLVQMPRRRFDATYKGCAIDYSDSEPREHYACWLSYTPREVTFLYSYSDEPLDAPPCAFACLVAAPPGRPKELPAAPRGAASGASMGVVK